MFPAVYVPEDVPRRNVSVLVKEEATVIVLPDCVNVTLAPGAKLISPEVNDPPPAPVALTLVMVSRELNVKVFPD